MSVSNHSLIAPWARSGRSRLPLAGAQGMSQQGHVIRSKCEEYKETNGWPLRRTVHQSVYAYLEILRLYSRTKWDWTLAASIHASVGCLCPVGPPPLLGEMLPSIMIHPSICSFCFLLVSSVESCHSARGRFQSPVPGEHHLPWSVLNYPIDSVTSWRRCVPSQKANRSRAQHPRKRPSNRLDGRH